MRGLTQKHYRKSKSNFSIFNCAIGRQQIHVFYQKFNYNENLQADKYTFLFITMISLILKSAYLEFKKGRNLQE